MKKLNAILINSKSKTIETVEVENDYKAIQKAIGVDCFTCVSLANGETLYLDDEGLINNTATGFEFSKDFSEGFFAGNGLILGTTKSGDSASTKMTVEELKKKYNVGRFLMLF